MWGIFLGSLIFIYGLAALLPPRGASIIGWPIAAIGLTIALMATARYAVDLMVQFVSIKPSDKKTIYDDMGYEPPPLSNHIPGTPLP